MQTGCLGCRAEGNGFELAMAYQPIIDAETGTVFAYEALVRGSRGQSASEVLADVTPKNRYAFDQQCRVSAIKGAVTAGILESQAKLSINFLPNAVYSPEACIKLTLKTAQEFGFPLNRLIFEFTENEHIADTEHVKRIISSYRKMGFTTALDDFGAGHAGLGLLANFQTDLIKLDMKLVQGISLSEPRRLVVAGATGIARALGITVIAEGIETTADYQALRDLGIRYFQGFLFARPSVGRLPLPVFPTPLLDAPA